VILSGGARNERPSRRISDKLPDVPSTFTAGDISETRFDSTHVSAAAIGNVAVEQDIKIAEPIPIIQEEGFIEDPSGVVDLRDSGFWTSFLMAAALTSIAVGIVWDISWHETIGRDTFWTPAHMAIYLGGVLGGSVGGWLAFKHTFLAGPAERGASVGLLGARAPLGAWVAIWGAIAMITSAPFDDWWHNAYGLDVRIVSPPHAVLGLGMFAISVGALLLVLSRQNRLQDVASTKGSGLFIYTGGVFVLLGSVFLLEYIFPNQQHTGMFYKVCALMYPARLVALSLAGRISWPATRVASVYIVFLCGMDWILGLFPGEPKLAPIFNPVTHMVALPFPLLLVFPGLAIDLLLRKAGDSDGILRRFGLAIILGGAFLAVFIAVQWHFSEFLLSPNADNWFFMSDRIWSYNFRPGEWQDRFWRVDPKEPQFDPLNLSAILTAWALASGSSWVGLFFGRWMRKVRR
jgi:hypothetical protein